MPAGRRVSGDVYEGLTLPRRSGADSRQSRPARADNKMLPVPMRLGETPVPIPNTTVKTQTADGTALETMWESRWAPDQEKNRRYPDHIYSAQRVLDGSVSHARGVQKDRKVLRFLFT